MTIPHDDLNMREPEHVAWVKAQRDPELWHAAAMAILNFVGDPQGFLVWLADQPETDRATAGYVFFGGDGWAYLRGQTDHWRNHNGLSEAEWLNAMEAFCRRAATTGFSSDSLGLHPGFATARKTCLELIARGEMAEGVSIPRALLDAPFPPERPLRYMVEDGSVVDTF